MWLAFKACKCRESCTVYVCAGAKREIYLLDIWLYIRVFLYYILYNFFKRVFEFMCMTKKGVMVFLFFFRKKQPFSAFTNIQLRCLIAWSKKTQLVIAYIQRLFVRDNWFTLYSKQKQNTWLHLNVFFFDKPWPYGNTVHVHCYRMKEELRCKLFWYVRWFKLVCWQAVGLSTFDIHFTNEQICIHDICRQECRNLLGVGRHSACFDTVKSTVHTYCTTKALPPVSQCYKLLQSCSDLAGRKSSSLDFDRFLYLSEKVTLAPVHNQMWLADGCFCEL